MMHDMYDQQCLNAGITPGCYKALLVGTCKEFLPKSEGRAGGALGVVVTPEAAGRLLAGGGA